MAGRCRVALRAACSERRQEVCGWSSATWCGGAAWCAGTPTDPVDPAVLDRGARPRGPGAERRVHPGCASCCVLDEPAAVARFWDADDRPGAEPRQRSGWMAACAPAPVVVVPLTSREAYLDRYAEPDKGWTDRDPRPLAGAVLVRRRRHGARCCSCRPAVDEGLGGCSFGIPPERVDAFRAAFGVPADRLPGGRGHAAVTGPTRRPRRGRRPVGVVRPSAREVVHRGLAGAG